MSPGQNIDVDVVIFGGGAAGLWILDELRRAGFAALLLEAGRLGSGQTIASQGIIHGGLKYTLSGMLTPSADAIRDMPLIWRRCVAGEREPSLRRTRLRAEHCYLWRTSSLTSKLAMIGARAGLRIAPVQVENQDRPAALADCPGPVLRLDEQVIDPQSFVHDLADRNRGLLLQIDAAHGLEIDRADSDAVRIRLIAPDSGRPLDVRARRIVLAAGAGNARLRSQFGLDEERMQSRPLKMVMLRGNLPKVNGHCVDGAKTRVTITTAADSSGATIWQVGGEIAEAGVNMADDALLRQALAELIAVLPGVKFDAVQWATYTARRAELRTRGGLKPDDATVLVDESIVTVWPTKLALAPRCGSLVLDALGSPSGATIDSGLIKDWPRPGVALPPWEKHATWFNDL